jgi:hypothetical protein
VNDQGCRVNVARVGSRRSPGRASHWEQA